MGESVEIPQSLRKAVVESAPDRVFQRYASLKGKAAESDFGALDDCVVLDTECTGVSFRHDELTQIAAARVRGGKVVDWYITFVNPGMPIPEDIVRLTNIHDSDVADAPSPEEATAKLVEFVGADDVVAHNANFDKTFCTKARSGAPLKDNVWIDSLDVGRIALPRMKSHRLIDLTRAFDVVSSTHRADDDVRSLASVYRIMLAGVDEMPKGLVNYIAQLCDVDEWPAVRVFQHFADATVPPVSLRSMRDEVVKSTRTPSRVDPASNAGDPDKALSFPSDDEVASEFTADGLVGRMYPDYESRPEQVQMAQAVNHAFSSSENLAVEAGTGVGKSIAYLVPSLLAARRNNMTVGVATKTNALLDQLVNHELPAMRQAGADVEFAALKGFQHYPCLLQLERLMEKGAQLKDEGDRSVSTAPAIAGLLSFVEQSDYDDMDALNWDRRAVPRYQATVSSEACIRQRCPFFGDRCFVFGARRRAEHADVLVTNQTLLFYDAAADGGLLPHIRYWVVDEAHGAVDEARRAFSKKIDIDDLLRLAGRLGSEGSHKDVFTTAEGLLSGQVNATDEDVDKTLSADEAKAARSAYASQGDVLVHALAAKGRRAGEAFDQAARLFCSHLKDLQAFDDRGSKGYSQTDVWINEQTREHSTFKNLVAIAHQMCDAAEKALPTAQSMLALMDDVPGTVSAQREMSSAIADLKALVNDCQIILFDAPRSYAYSAHLVKRDKGHEYLQAQLLDVGSALDETLYANTHSVVFTSATLTTNQDFNVFVQSMGLNEGEESKASAVQIPSGYDFDHNMTVYVVDDMPEPNEGGYLRALERFLAEVHKAQGGSTLSLFTNRREMEKCFDAVEPVVEDDGLRVVCQKYGLSVKNLRDQFVQDESLSLFALKSFWEGFDAPGATLKSVVIPKLPFDRPSDPLCRELNAVNGNAWRTHTLPRSILEVKQAAGRLIRSSTDTGNLVLLDRRLTTKWYGKVFIASLPSRNVKRMHAHQVIEDIARQQG